MKTIGIVAHSFEGGTLSFLTTCREGASRLGPHMHPTIVVSAIPMALSMPGWESGDHDAVGAQLSKGIRQVAEAGADFYLCPDNTAHIVLEKIALKHPIPGLHIADVVCAEIAAAGWTKVGLLGTKWTMTGPVYEQALARRKMQRILPDEKFQARIQAAIFDELCQSVFRPATTAMFVDAIRQVQELGAECVILGCTEIPLIINAEISPIPVLDTTRLQARYAVNEALREGKPQARNGWLEIARSGPRASAKGG